MNEEMREFLMRWRQAILIQLGALEECLHIARSVQPKHKRLGKRGQTGGIHDSVIVHDIERPLDSLP